MWFSAHLPIACHADTHQEGALFVHMRKGGLSPHLPFTARPPAEDWRLFPAFDPLFISPLPLIAERATATVWSATGALLLLREVRRRWAQTHRLECRSDLGKPSETIQSGCLCLGTADVLVR